MNLKFDFEIFKDESHALFPFQVAPKADELFTSWVLRLAHANYFKAYTFTKAYLKTTTFWNRDTDRFPSEEIITALALKTNRSHQEISSLTLKDDERLFRTKDVYGSNRWILPLGIYHRTWKKNGLMFCSRCLKKALGEPYFKKNWRYAFFVVCTECNIMLRDHCPMCKKPIIFFRSELGKKSVEPNRYISTCYDCDYNLANSIAQPANPLLIALQNDLISIWNDGWKENIIYPHMFFDVLRYWLGIFLSKRARLKNLRYHIYSKLGFDFKVDIPGGFQNRFDALSVEERSIPLQAAYWLLQEWPTRFISTIHQVNLYSSDLLKDFEEPPFWYWSVVIENFYVTNINRNFKSNY